MAHIASKRGKRRIVGSIMVNGKRREKWFPDASKASQRAAATWEAEERERMLEAALTPTASLNVQTWVTEYLNDVVRRKLSKKTYEEKKAAFIRFAEHKSVSPELPVEDVDRFLARRFLDDMLDTGRSGNAVNKDRKNLGAAWKWGCENLKGWPIGENPFHAVAKYQEERSPRYVPPDDDFWKFTDHLEALAQSGDPQAVQDHVMHQVFLHLAARRGEVFRLKRSDLDFDQDRVRLWTRKRRGGQLESDWLPMPSGLRALLINWLQIRLTLPADSEHVFVCLSKTEFCDPYYLKPFTARIHFMRRICNRIGIKPFGFHAIRHFSATHLFRKGYALRIIQTILRHKSPSTTERYLRSIGLDPAVREALEEGISRPAKVFNLDDKRASVNQ